ncbi:hypothetical protein [Peterkaempfera sp. SMS 1(5)a]|uniref:hypothetical protein n=1 Tax=Peterkaempfera podocarpi TaxID=3232308 RepID=UPI003671971C
MESGRPSSDPGSGDLLKQDHLAKQAEAGAPVELPFDLLDAVHGAFDAAGARFQGEAGCDGVEVSEQMECEAGQAGQAGQLAAVDCLDPVRQLGGEAAGEDLAEVADVLGGRVQLGATGQDLF